MALTPFKPGQSGNPSGRPKMSEEHRKAFGEISELGIKALRAILDGSDESAKASDRIKAADVAFDRIWGKAPQTINGDINTGVRVIDTSKLPKDQLEAVALLAVENMAIDDQS